MWATVGPWDLLSAVIHTNTRGIKWNSEWSKHVCVLFSIVTCQHVWGMCTKQVSSWNRTQTEMIQQTHVLHVMLQCFDDITVSNTWQHDWACSTQKGIPKTDRIFFPSLWRSRECGTKAVLGSWPDTLAYFGGKPGIKMTVYIDITHTDTETTTYGTVQTSFTSARQSRSATEIN